MNALDTRLNFLCSKLELLQQEEVALRQRQIALGKEIQEFLLEFGCPENSHPIQIIKHFRLKKVLETL